MAHETQKPRPPFNIIHRDLDRALAMCGLSPNEQILMLRAREECYGVGNMQHSPDPIPFDLNITAEAKRWGVNRSRLQIAKASLVASKLWVETADGQYLINKRYKEWEGVHKLSAKAIKGAREVRKSVPEPPETTVAQAQHLDPQSGVAQAQQSGVAQAQQSEGGVAEAQQSSVAQAQQSGVAQAQQSKAAGLEDRARILESREESGKECLSTEEDDTRHSIFDHSTSESKPHFSSSLSPEEIRTEELAMLASKLFPDDIELPGLIRVLAFGVPAEWVDDAIRKAAARRPRPDKLYPYICSIFRGTKAAGGLRESKTLSTANGMPPRPFSKVAESAKRHRDAARKPPEERNRESR